ncbi:MAG: hypothetical protein MI924_20080 [Chloroflexales bacterium]|nr:hypothetical protein [Chloroflexales bacterium]
MRREKVAGIILTLGLLAVGSGYLWLGGAAPQGELPVFEVRLTLDERHIVKIHSGPVCLPELPQHACAAGVTRDELSISYLSPHKPPLTLRLR